METLPIVLECILEQTSDGIILLDSQDRICLMSAAAHHMLHIEGESMVGHHWEELPLRSPNDPSIKGALSRAIRFQRDAAVCPAPQQVATDRGKTLLLTAMALPQDVNLENCTWRRLVILREARGGDMPAGILSGSRLLAGSDREETTDALADLAQAVAHEIRNPVMVIGGFARILQRRYPNLEHINEILQNSQRLEAARHSGIRRRPKALPAGVVRRQNHPLHAQRRQAGGPSQGRRQRDADHPRFRERTAAGHDRGGAADGRRFQRSALLQPGPEAGESGGGGHREGPS